MCVCFTVLLFFRLRTMAWEPVEIRFHQHMVALFHRLHPVDELQAILVFGLWMLPLSVSPAERKWHPHSQTNIEDDRSIEGKSPLSISTSNKSCRGMQWCFGWRQFQATCPVLFAFPSDSLRKIEPPEEEGGAWVLESVRPDLSQKFFRSQTSCDSQPTLTWLNWRVLKPCLIKDITSRRL